MIISFLLPTVLAAVPPNPRPRPSPDYMHMEQSITVLSAENNALNVNGLDTWLSKMKKESKDKSYLRVRDQKSGHVYEIRMVK